MQNEIVFSVVVVAQGTARIFLLTKNNFVLADQKTGQVKASVPLPGVYLLSIQAAFSGRMMIIIILLMNDQHRFFKKVSVRHG